MRGFAGILRHKLKEKVYEQNTILIHFDDTQNWRYLQILQRGQIQTNQPRKRNNDFNHLSKMQGKRSVCLIDF